MRQATGEANITVIIIILISIITAFGVVFLPKNLTKASDKSCCLKNEGIWHYDKCYEVSSCEIDESTNQIIKCSTLLDAKC